MRKTPGWFLVNLMILSLPAASVLADAGWPGLRGPDSNGAVHDARLFPSASAGLKVGWKRPLGSGYSSVAVADGRVVTMFADGENDVVAAFDMESGDELWRYAFAETYPGHDGSHDGPISTPVIGGGRVFGLGPWGHLFAVNAEDGKVLWTRHLVEDFESVTPHYGFATSPLLVEDILVLEMGAAEGKAVAGFSAADGKLVWTAGDDTVNYHSPILTTIAGRLQVLAAGKEKLFGIEPRSGEILWSHEHGGDGRGTGSDTIIPLPAGEGRFLVLNKRDGSTMFQIKKGKEIDYEVQELWSNNSIRGTYVTPVYSDGYIYGTSGRVLVCLDAATGEVQWRSRQPGDGFPTLVGKDLVIITKPGGLHVAKASPDGYAAVTELDLFDEHSWSQVAYADGHLFARSMGHLARIDVTSGGSSHEVGQSWLARTRFGAFLAELERTPDKAALVDTFLEKQGSFPIVEAPDVVHFVYRGEAEDVGIAGDMIGSRREEPMTRVQGTDLFYYSTRLEADAAVTYGFIVDFGETMADPRNPLPGKGLFGEVSWLSMPARDVAVFDGEPDTSRQGRMETVEQDREMGEDEGQDEGEDEGEDEAAKLTAEVYLPADYDGDSRRRYPTVYVYGGGEALEEGGMKNALDHLIGRKIDPLIAVFVKADDGATYDADSYNKMVLTELIPLIDDRYRTLADAHHRGVMGSGSGAATALYGSFQHPDIFGRVGSQPPEWWVDSETPLEESMQAAEASSLSIYLDWGTYGFRSPHEAWDLSAATREVWAQLRASSYRPAGGERPEGYGWSCWRGHTADMLVALFPLQRQAS